MVPDGHPGHQWVKQDNVKNIVAGSNFKFFKFLPAIAGRNLKNLKFLPATSYHPAIAGRYLKNFKFLPAIAG